MTDVFITGTGLYTPPNSVSNDELVSAFNQYVELYNEQNKAQIESGELEPLGPSSSEFIEKASGIKSRFVVSKDGLLDPEIMTPLIPERPNEEISVLAEIGLAAAKKALEAAGREASDIDCIICAASNMQRAYPAISIEIQAALGASENGFAFDMNVACSSATFGIQTAADMIRSGSAKSVLVINPEICSGHLNFRDRDSHFIFGDVATAVLVEGENTQSNGARWRILGTKLKTQFSNNIRNNFGFLNRAAPEGIGAKDKLFVQEGRKVFKEVVPMVAAMITEQLGERNIEVSSLKRLWLHQANAGMNRLISSKVLGREATSDESPTVLDTYANTSSAGSIIAFNKYSDDFKIGELGIICSFGAGYSAGMVFVQRVS